MIQRIQSLFWLLSMVSLGFFLFTNTEVGIIVQGIIAIAILFNIIAIFSFQNRKRQILISYLAIFCMIGYLGYFVGQHMNTPSSIEALKIIPLTVSIILNILANHFTRKDIKLVEGSSRLR